MVWSVTVSCGRCDRCAAGLTQKCRDLGKYGHDRIAPHRELTGGFASHVQLRAGTHIVRVAETLPAATLAPASCATATAWAAVARAGRLRPLDGARVRVYGAGLVGLSAAAIAAVDVGGVVVLVGSVFPADPVLFDASRDRRRRSALADLLLAGLVLALRIVPVVRPLRLRRLVGEFAALASAVRPAVVGELLAGVHQRCSYGCQVVRAV
ncbi:alcohol dehydrogenase catalytic domain-containing protein [Microbacterium sp. EF45047]|uniref:alcohol dehydrogenase catalytic domain-containing protein n=1 Tax=Microbacterium sp. EF45047 TaxID=2809708 RepID=UPI002348F18F|nr:alcohol dehydrogenase catalytic domain-containing protein [Microbacterium sp. EF45047]WCM55407.1 alcohol dehydrogenase catalytic domain-containing protein [Microbacterium sp. EF45047]